MMEFCKHWWKCIKVEKNRLYSRGISKRKIKFLIIHCFYTPSLIIGISSVLFLFFLHCSFLWWRNTNEWMEFGWGCDCGPRLATCRVPSAFDLSANYESVRFCAAYHKEQYIHFLFPHLFVKIKANARKYSKTMKLPCDSSKLIYHLKKYIQSQRGFKGCAMCGN